VNIPLGTVVGHRLVAFRTRAFHLVDCHPVSIGNNALQYAWLFDSIQFAILAIRLLDHAPNIVDRFGTVIGSKDDPNITETSLQYQCFLALGGNCGMRLKVIRMSID
jgi:hypothetical protein